MSIGIFKKQKSMKYEVREFYGAGHVLTRAEARPDSIPTANFKGTGCALAGLLRKGETLNEWIKRCCKEYHNVNKYPGKPIKK